MKIKIKIGSLSMDAELNDTATARKVADALPLTTSFSTWGDEIYFSMQDGGQVRSWLRSWDFSLQLGSEPRQEHNLPTTHGKGRDEETR